MVKEEPPSLNVSSRDGGFGQGGASGFRNTF